MQVLVCIDDTDNLESRGTGELASILAQAVEEHGWGMGVSRGNLKSKVIPTLFPELLLLLGQVKLNGVRKVNRIRAIVCKA